MASTAADVLIDTLNEWGVDVIFGLPGDGINGIIESFAHASGSGAFRAGASRRGSRIHGLWLREAHRSARLLPGHLRSGWRPSPQRALRRQAGRRARGGADWNAAPRPDPYAHPAGRGTRQIVHGRGGVQHAGHESHPCAQRHRACLPQRLEPARGRPRVHAGGSAERSRARGRRQQAQRAGPQCQPVGPGRSPPCSRCSDATRTAASWKRPSRAWNAGTPSWRSGAASRTRR